MSPCVVVVSLTCCTVAVPQASEAVGGVNTGVPSHAIVVLAPAEPIVGPVVSCTVMLCMAVPLVLLHASVARQLLIKVFTQLLPEVVVPRSAGVNSPSQLSDAVGAVKLGVKSAGHPSTVVLAPA